MASFKDTNSHIDWRKIRHQPVKLPNKPVGVKYLTDLTGSDDISKTRAFDYAEDDRRYVAADQQATALLENSVQWPMKSIDQRNPVPYVMGTTAAIFVAPFVDPTATFGAALVTGYFAGALSYYLMNLMMPQPSKIINKSQ